MAITYPVGPRYAVTSADNGHFLVLGDVSEHEEGFWRITFVPDIPWVGGFGVLGRASGKAVSDDGQGFGTVAYREVQRTGVSRDPSVLVQASAVAVPLVNTDFIIHVPSSGLCIALLVDWTQGTGTLYSQPLRGLSI